MQSHLIEIIEVRKNGAHWIAFTDIGER